MKLQGVLKITCANPRPVHWTESYTCGFNYRHSQTDKREWVTCDKCKESFS